MLSYLRDHADQVVIVTNAKMSWIDTCLDKFLPAISHFVRQVRGAPS
jgi:hypothetical protein